MRSALFALPTVMLATPTMRLGKWLLLALVLIPGPTTLAQTRHSLPLVKSAANPDLTGFVRVINRSDSAGTVRVHGVDDSGRRFGPISLDLEANASAHFNSVDLESGNANKGLSGGLGDGTGDWRLELESTLDIEVLGYVRTADGFVTSVHDLVVEGGSGRYRVPFFNPGRNLAQVSRLRLINTGDVAADVVIDGRDDRGEPSDEHVSLVLPAGAAQTVTAQELESGASGLIGRFGTGKGKWQLSVSSNVPILVMNLLQTPTGHLTNLSTSTGDGEGGSPPPRPGTRLRDCDECPELVVVPPGVFWMGSPSSEAGRRNSEGPMHEVWIERPFAAGRFEVTRQDYSQFVSETGYATASSCTTYEDGRWEMRVGRTWRTPGIEQTERHPVVCVSWSDAKAYVGWLSRKTGYAYRLLSESEWEYIARAGTTTARYWGDHATGQCRYANGHDLELANQHSDWFGSPVECNDGHAATSPVGTYEANAFGFHDVLGNVWEWVEDCRNDNYSGAPVYGEAWETGNCGERIRRGGSWTLDASYLRSARRNVGSPEVRGFWGGFRVARGIVPSGPDTGPPGTDVPLSKLVGAWTGRWVDAEDSSITIAGTDRSNLQVVYCYAEQCGPVEGAEFTRGAIRWGGGRRFTFRLFGEVLVGVLTDSGRGWIVRMTRMT